MVLLHVTVHSCQDLGYPKKLVSANKILPNPSTFVELYCGGRRWRTAPVPMSDVPAWNELLQVTLDEEDRYWTKGSAKVVNVSVNCLTVAQCVVSLGSVSVGLDELVRGQTRRQWYPLTRTRDSSRSSSIQLGLLLVGTELDVCGRSSLGNQVLPRISIYSIVKVPSIIQTRSCERTERSRAASRTRGNAVKFVKSTASVGDSNFSSGLTHCDLSVTLSQGCAPPLQLPSLLSS